MMGAMETIVVGVRLSKDVRDRLQEIAGEEHRSLSNLISKILLDYLKEKSIHQQEGKPAP
jgi:predicted transcriptional regulator